jgi:hypothetical protein
VTAVHTDSADPLTDSQLLLTIHTEAASIADVTGITWRHKTIAVTAATSADADAIGEHLTGGNHRVGHWRMFDLNHPERPSRAISVVVEEAQVKW